MHHSIIIGLQGSTLTSSEKILLEKPYVSGVLLLAPNMTSEAQVKSLTRDIKGIRPEESFLITADFEAKRVWRAKNEDGSPCDYLPQPQESMRDLGIQYENANAQERLDLLKTWEDYAKELGLGLLNLGINVNLAPVLDSHHDDSQIIGGIKRAFSANPACIIACARAFLRGFKSAGLHTNVKHWPDHGVANQDSHLEATIDYRNAADIKPHLHVYETLIGEGLVDSVMTAHVLYPSIDPDHIASRSQIWHDILHNDLQFKGTVHSDCMTMKGAGDSTLSDKLYDAFSSGTNSVILGGLAAGHPLHDKYPLNTVEDMMSSTEEALRMIGNSADHTNVL